jgi:class 3 adenylate cyclase
VQAINSSTALELGGGLAIEQPVRVERRLAAIVAADVTGYSRLMGLDEVGTARALANTAQ